jgi:5-methylcytosine-specific restriction endonuclease McrBC regulatory subunit McrC
MNELFERFCEVGLREVSDQEVWVGYKNRNLGSDFTVRPDFLVTVNKQAWIVDAKYKRDWSWKDKNYRTDIYQVVAYSRHKKVLQLLLNLNSEMGGKPEIVVLYPFDSAAGRNGFDPSHGLSVQYIFNNSEDRLDEFEIQIVRAPIILPENN